MRDFSDEIKGLRARIGEAEEYLHIEDHRRIRPQLETEASRPDLWDDADLARKITGELSSVIADLDLYADLDQRLADAATLAEMAREEGDESFEPEIESALADLARELSDLELRSLFTGDYDDHDAVCAVQSGEGGADAQDWAEMLLRMYLRWAADRGFATELEEVTAGSEAGISSATFIVKGRFAHGLLRAEKGTHRLVRMSPFNAQGKRQTAFAALDVVPLIEEDDGDIVIEDKDLRVDTYRASGAGGQHINKTDSAIRLTHLPTGIVVSCQNQRSQHQNKDRAMQVLKAKLADVARQERQAEMDGLRGEKQRVGFGTQIRSYVMHPYQMVKDLRSGYEVGNVASVLDGDLTPFMEAYLRWERAGADPLGGDDD